MSKKGNRLILFAFMTVLVGTLLVSCTPAQEPSPSPIANGILAAATIPPQASPTLAMPSISINPETTAVPQQITSPPLVPSPTPAAAGLTLHVPILMYHYISVPPADADIYRNDLSVTPENFREQMTYLAENGFTPIDLYQLSAAIAAKIELPEKPVVLTFDDGYLDNYENAFPILQEFGFTGTFFIITDYADQGVAGYANWQQLKEMSAAGMRIETHTKNHPDLSTMGRDDVIFQVLGSQETIAAHIGYTPRYLCYPSGQYNEETIQILRELDFWGATTTQNGGWHNFEDRYEWTRQRMHLDTTLEQFRILVDPENTVGGKKLAEN